MFIFIFVNISVVQINIQVRYYQTCPISEQSIYLNYRHPSETMSTFQVKGAEKCPSVEICTVVFFFKGKMSSEKKKKKKDS